MILFSSREQRNSFIRSKYEMKRHAIMTCADKAELKQELYQAVATQDIYALLQVYAEGGDLMSNLPSEVHALEITGYRISKLGCSSLLWSPKAGIIFYRNGLHM